MVHQWEFDKIKNWTTDEIKNRIWMHSNGQPIPGSVSVDALRIELIRRENAPKGYHNS